MIAKGGYIYIVTNINRTVFYIGVTSNLVARIYEHKFEEGSKFTKKYNCKDVVYYEIFDCIETAIEEEKRIKRWRRDWKIELIRKANPKMRDLYDKICELDLA